MTEGEQFKILEMEGDKEGWTFVQRRRHGVKGFVPSAFLVVS